MITLVCSAKGSPGVTTTAAALALRWPRFVVLAELDTSGGSLVAWWAAPCGLSYEPGLISLVAARHGLTGDTLVLHAQQITSLAFAVGAPPSGVQTRTAVASLMSRIDRTTFAEIDIIIDAGRLDVSPDTGRLCDLADHTLIVTRPDLASVATTEPLVAFARQRTTTTVLAVGQHPYRAADLAEHLDVTAMEIAADGRGASLVQRDPRGKAVARTALARSLASVAASLTTIDEQRTAAHQQSECEQAGVA